QGRGDPMTATQADQPGSEGNPSSRRAAPARDEDGKDSPPAFGGHDPDRVLHTAISASTPTKCQARTRLYRDGVLEAEGFPVDDISDYLKDHSCVVWLDLRDPDREDLAVLATEFGLHPLAIEDAVVAHERPKLDRYQSHLFMTAYGVQLDTDTGELLTSE